MGELITSIGTMVEENQFMILCFLLIILFYIVMKRLRKHDIGVKLVVMFSFVGLFSTVVTIYGSQGFDIVGKTEKDPNNIVWWIAWLIPLIMVILMANARKRLMKK